jgi:Mrp family chromosome partitioning ATPase
VLAPATAAPQSTSDGFSAPASRLARSLIGLVVGLIAGLALVIAFERIDPKVRSTAQAEMVFGLPVIAEITRTSRWRSRRRGGVTTFSDPHSIIAENYRGLRTALTYLPRATDTPPLNPGAYDGDRFASGHVVLVTSAEPAEGKTTVVANLAASFAEKDGDVVVVSGDARHPAIESLLLGRRAAGAKLAAKEHSDSVVTMIPGVSLVLSCDPVTNPADIVAYERAIVRRARARSQTVIIDTPPALVANDAIELMQSADSIVLVARCGSTSMAAARRSAELIARLHVAVIGVVLVGTAPAAVAGSSYYRSHNATLKEWRRRDRSATEIRGRRGRSRALTRQAPSPLADDATTRALAAAKSTHAVSGQPVDDGGIWRPKAVIDLSGVDIESDDQLPADVRSGQRRDRPLFHGSEEPTNGAQE